MEINGPGSPERAFEKQQRALIDANRARVRAARQDLASVGAERAARSELAPVYKEPKSEERRDEIRLSSAASASSEASVAEREARVRELAEAHRMERLHTPERIERAAQRLLEG